ILFQTYSHIQSLLSFPTRRSSDLDFLRQIGNDAIRKRIRHVWHVRVHVRPCWNRAHHTEKFIGRATQLREAEAPLRHVSRFQQRSEEHTSELQSRGHLVCRLLLEK